MTATQTRKKSFAPIETYGHPETGEIVELAYVGGPHFLIEVGSTDWDGRDRLRHDTVEEARETWREARAHLARRGFVRCWF